MSLTLRSSSATAPGSSSINKASAAFHRAEHGLTEHLLTSLPAILRGGFFYHTKAGVRPSQQDLCTPTHRVFRGDQNTNKHPEFHRTESKWQRRSLRGINHFLFLRRHRCLPSLSQSYKSPALLLYRCITTHLSSSAEDQSSFPATGYSKKQPIFC